MRVYVPLTVAGLRAVLAQGRLGPAPLTGYAVTPALREALQDELRDGPAEGVEELEYAALRQAAAASLRLLAADPDAPRRRVVLAADVAGNVARPGADDEPAQVRLLEPVALAQVAAGHVDDAAAEAAVTAGVAALSAAVAGDAGARAAVDAVENHELLWYATQELADLG